MDEKEEKYTIRERVEDAQKRVDEYNKLKKLKKQNNNNSDNNTESQKRNNLEVEL